MASVSPTHRADLDAILDNLSVIRGDAPEQHGLRSDPVAAWLADRPIMARISTSMDDAAPVYGLRDTTAMTGDLREPYHGPPRPPAPWRQAGRPIRARVSTSLDELSDVYGLETMDVSAWRGSTITEELPFDRALLPFGSPRRRRNRTRRLPLAADAERLVEQYELVLADDDDAPSQRQLAERLGITDRTLRRHLLQFHRAYGLTWPVDPPAWRAILARRTRPTRQMSS